MPRFLQASIDATNKFLGRTTTMHPITIIHSITKENLLHGEHVRLAIRTLIESLVAEETHIFAAKND